MDQDLYDEFGNYIGPDEDESESSVEVRLLGTVCWLIA